MIGSECTWRIGGDRILPSARLTLTADAVSSRAIEKCFQPLAEHWQSQCHPGRVQTCARPFSPIVSQDVCPRVPRANKYAIKS